MDFIKCTNLLTGKQKMYASIIVRNHAMREKIGLIVSDPNYDSNGNKIEATLIIQKENTLEVVKGEEIIAPKKKSKELKTNKKK